MTRSSTSDRRHAKRFETKCVVTVMTRRNRLEHKFNGKLHDISVGGARFYLQQPLAVGARLTLDVHFPNLRKGVTVITFEGVVTRARRELRYEIAAQFRGAGKFLRDNVKKIMDEQETVQPLTGQPSMIGRALTDLENCSFRHAKL